VGVQAPSRCRKNRVASLGRPSYAASMMTTAEHLEDDPFGPQARDYERMAEAISFIEENQLSQPRLEDVAAAMGLSPAHAQRIFTRWAGVSPKRLLALLTHVDARAALNEGAPLLDAAFEAGLSGPGRLHDLFVSVEAMTPGEVKRKGEGLEIRYGWHDTPFGAGLYMTTPRGLCGLAFADPGTEGTAIEDMRARWPNAAYIHDPATTAPIAARVFAAGAEDEPLKVLLGGTPFQMQVWRALLEIPFGETRSYTDIAKEVCTERAVRAVGSAVGRNPISFLIPCHRVLRQTKALGGYHWGLTRKKALLAWETAKTEA